MDMSSPCKGRGFVLVMVLWLIALLTIIALGLSYNTRQSVRGVGALVGATQARYLAHGGVQLALMNLLGERPEHRLLGDGEQLAVQLPNGSVNIAVFDESGKVGINTASPELLSRLFEAFDMEERLADALADAVVDYRDPDDLVSLNGAEDDQYLAAGLPWEAKDSDFTRIEELQRVYGMPAWLYENILPYVTIHNIDRGINPEVAPLPVLISASDDSVYNLEAYIKGRRENRILGLPLPAPPAVDRKFTARARGTVFTIIATGWTSTGYHASITTTVRVKRGGSNAAVETLDWIPYKLDAATGSPQASGEL
ncbi:MAG TPA: hypothetical protein DIT58_09920 [Porticoccaceae bacterium]|nr:hypothetical protein [Porticoccaceae bacterium]